MKKPPCEQTCTNRCPGCHDHCEKYAEWKADCERVKEWLRKENQQLENEKVKRAGWKNMRWGNRKYKPKK